MSFETTSWTSTRPFPFGPAPGGGLSGVRRKQADLSFESGFALEAFGAEYTLPDEIIKAKGPFTVTRKDVITGQVPAALVQMVFTDRGAINQGVLDQDIYMPIKAAGLRMSAATRFYPVDVNWEWRKQDSKDYGGGRYFPVVVAPAGSPAASLDGLVYAGSAISASQLLDSNFMPSAELLAKLPKQLWIYSFAVTNPNNQFTNANGAQLLTAMKSAWANTLPGLGASAYGYVTLMGADASVFEAPPGPEPIAKKSNTWLWLLGAAVVAGYAHTPKPGSASAALARKLSRR